MNVHVLKSNTDSCTLILYLFIEKIRDMGEEVKQLKSSLQACQASSTESESQLKLEMQDREARMKRVNLIVG